MAAETNQHRRRVPRFCAGRTDRVQLDRLGYLVDPTPMVHGVSANPAARGTDQVSDHRCAALLGEPGSGKTVALDEIRQHLEANASDPSRVRTVDLAQYGDERRLLGDLFGGPQGDESLAAGRLVLLLDGLDECKLQIPRVGKLLAGALRAQPTERLGFFIACRSADWPAALGEVLGELYEDFVTYDLLPLRRVDVADLARQDGKDDSAFLAAVEALSVVPLATRPLTLKLLLNAFDPVEQRLPGGQVAVYQQGLLALVDEWNRDRREAGLGGRLTPEQRLGVARRLAALMIFSGSSALWSGWMPEAPNGDLAVGRCVGGKEPTPAGEVRVSREAVEETIATALFVGLGPGRSGWAHQTYMEYLAASYLVSRQPQSAQLRNLLVSGDSLVPQLRPVTTWLGAMGGLSLDALIAADPQSFIGHGIDLTDDTAKAQLVDSLLDHARRGELRHQPGIDLRSLDHPTLASQLRPVLADPTEDDQARHWAIDISEAAGATDLQDTWVSIALDPAAPERLRVNAGYAVVRLGSSHSKAALRTLADGTVGLDPDDELKGVGLQAAWPGTFTITEVLERLTRPKRQNLLGAYKSFLVSVLPESLEPADVVEVLKWAAAVPEQRARGRGPDQSFQPLIDCALRIAAQHADEDEVADAFAQVALWRGRRHEPIVSRGLHEEPLEMSEPARQRFVEAVLPLIKDHKDAFALLDLRPPLIMADDFAHVLQKAKEAECSSNTKGLGYLAAHLFSVADPVHRELVLALGRETDLYRSHFAQWCEPIRLASERARRHREWRAQREGDSQPADALLDSEELRARLGELLDAAVAGDMKAWWQFNRWLCADPSELHSNNELADDLTTLPGWSLLTAAQKDAVFDVAERYLSEGSANTGEWIDTDTLHRPAMAGYRAAVLLLRHARDRFDRLPAGSWTEWTGIAVAYPVNHDQDDAATRDELVRVIYEHAPESVLSAVKRLIMKDNERGLFFRGDVLEAIWDDRLAEELLAVLQSEDLSHGVYGQLLGVLLQHGWEPATREALAVLRGSDGWLGRERRVVAASTLLHGHPQSWNAVWEAALRDPSFGDEVFLKAANSQGLPTEVMDAESIADLYIWLSERFPPQEDPQFEDAHVVGPREALGLARDRLLSELIQRGSHEALQATERIAAHFPEREGLRYVALEAREAYRRNSWQRLAPETLLTMLDDPEKRLVRDGDELLQLLAEALDRVQHLLRGETPDAPLLWADERPKPEPQLADYLKNRLDEMIAERGVVANREVEVRRSPGAGIGERTDIHVDAVTGSQPGDLDVISAIIEIKGCWHDDVLTAIRDQLFEQYMQPAGVRHGVYVVFWFDPNTWSDQDGRRAKAARRNQQDVRKCLEDTAAALAAEGVSIRVALLAC